MHLADTRLENGALLTLKKLRMKLNNYPVTLKCCFFIWIILCCRFSVPKWFPGTTAWKTTYKAVFHAPYLHFTWKGFVAVLSSILVYRQHFTGSLWNPIPLLYAMLVVHILHWISHPLLILFSLCWRAVLLVYSFRLEKIWSQIYYKCPPAHAWCMTVNDSTTQRLRVKAIFH